MTECHRCPKEIVHAANQLMGLYDTQPMEPRSKIEANTHVIVWESTEAEATGMATAIAANIQEYPNQNHLAMVTRREFGYLLRKEISTLNPNLNIDLSFSESLLQLGRCAKHSYFFVSWLIQTRQLGELGSDTRTPTMAGNSKLQVVMPPRILIFCQNVTTTSP